MGKFSLPSGMADSFVFSVWSAKSAVVISMVSISEARASSFFFIEAQDPHWRYTKVFSQEKL